MNLIVALDKTRTLKSFIQSKKKKKKNRRTIRQTGVESMAE